MFENTVDQAAALGFENIVLTPINGDVFMDKNIFSRMRYIENSTIKNHSFYTNFIGADETAVTSIFSMRKLNYLEISVYGHDFDSFCNITGRGREQYRRLIENLTVLEAQYSEKPPGLNIVIGLRTYRSFRFGDHVTNELLEIIDSLRNVGVFVGLSSEVDNWGGAIDESDISSIEMDLMDGRFVYNKGPCGLPFDSIQITAAGKVNACACRDPLGSLVIGDINMTPLASILSADNEKWNQIILNHEKGDFNDVCLSCGFYQSIYDERRASDTCSLNKESYLKLL